MSIRLSEAALLYLQASLKGQKAQSIRVGVRQRGCAGYEYVVDFAKDKKETEKEIVLDGVSLVVDKGHLETFLEGTYIDYETKGLNAELKFHNPNAESHCGCGESFNLRKKEEDR